VKEAKTHSVDKDKRNLKKIVKKQGREIAMDMSKIEERIITLENQFGKWR